ncbi:sensor histidine kinase [Pedobacter nutrimenti]|uniref:Histidine kinase n=1 Tax=Pedobacter nutrimenti TaxID=1241337 RepID=A0A318UK92_9SPHI|nr:sensor histidine kinase [Pedobacter nutrimenti]PYF74405.1 histidine kinase [Pedobacter nutrimenti]
MQITQLIEKIYTKPSLRVGFHLIFWLLLFGVKLYLTAVSFNVYRSFPTLSYVYINLFSTLLLAAFYYLFVYVLIPVFFNKKKYFQGILVSLGLILLYTLTDTFTEMQLIKTCKACTLILQKDHPDYASYLNRGFINVVLTRILGLGTPMLLLFALCIPFSIKMTLQSFRNNLKTLQLSRDNMELELNFLKAQLNPHFLFNSMNNIYGLILTGNKEKSAALVARLSELLRYTLYDSNQVTMPLEKEVQLIRDYIELEKVRLNDSRVIFSYQTDSPDYDLAPMLLLPLIENAFKYSKDNTDSFIDIFLDIINGKLRFTIDNSMDTERLPGISGGIGLVNFKKRMDLYYPGKYWYEAGPSGTTYSVNLTIEL